jgi:transcriptional regulator with PAS, ATPase and Fis domain
MCAVWLLLSKTSYPAQLIESSERHGVKTVDVPFDISIDFMPERSPRVDEELRALTNGLPPITAELDAIVHQSPKMKSLIARARRVAAFDYPVLIQGETGTGKELLARAIHSVSHQKDGPFIPVNCGAIPETLVEAQFFGHKKGAFTGATGDQSGFIEAANGGTLFLDEIGELPRQAQVKLLRFLQEGTIQRIGETKERRAVVRVITATNRKLVEEVAASNFRADLFHRLAFGVLTIPPLRERGSDAELLIDSILSEINAKCSMIPGWTTKKLTPSARNLVRQYDWPGNVRELNSTLIRAAMWTSKGIIRSEDLRDAMISAPKAESDTVPVLGRQLGNRLELPAIMKEVAEHYLTRALEATAGNKTEAAKLLGLPSQQTLSNWVAKYIER